MHRHRSLDHIGLLPVVLAHPLNKQELAISGRFIRNAVGRARQDFVSLTTSERASMIRTTRLDREGALQHEIMIRTLAVIVPGNNVTVRQCEDTGLNVVADHDGLDVFHLVVRHLNAFSLRDGRIVRSRPTHAAASHGSALIFASRMTFAHFGISNLILATNSSAVFATGSNPSTAIRSFTSGSSMTFKISPCSRSTMALGVPAGTRTPCMVSASCSGRPASAKVGTSGKSGDRFGVVTANARSLPSLTCGTTGVTTVKAMRVWPASADWIAGADPLNGTWTRSSPCESLNSSPERCGVVPSPAEAKLYLPGLALISEMSSLTVRAGIEGCTVSTLGETAARVTGAKSLKGS